MRAIWKGSISFGLINIPVSLFAATRREELKFRLLRGSDLSPVNYKRVAELDGKEVPWGEIVKGYEYEKGKFVVLREEDFKRADVEATQTVDIIDFVKSSDVNPVYFYKPYYMEPTKTGTKAYVLLREVLHDTDKLGIAKVVIKTRQHLAAVKANDQGLILELMHFAEELATPDELHLPGKAPITKGEMDMAKLLIDRMTEPWRPDKYQDDYKSALLQLIEKKAASGGRTPRSGTKKKKTTNIIDLADVLKQSLSETKSQSRGKAKRKAARGEKKKSRKAA